MAKLYYRYGAMNSGKTTALLQVAFNYNERGMRVLILKASVDTKGGDHIVSRLGIASEHSLFSRTRCESEVDAAWHWVLEEKNW